MNQDLELKLQAWLDGELTAAEARSIGREIAADADASRLVTELQAIKSTLAGNELPMPLPESREFFWSKIERQIQREAAAERPAPVRGWAAWRSWMSPLAGFAALTCIILMATKPFAPATFDEISATFDEISSTGEGMEAVTFHDQSAGMTVVWLADTEQAAPAETPAVAVPDTTADSQVEME